MKSSISEQERAVLEAVSTAAETLGDAHTALATAVRRALGVSRDDAAAETIDRHVRNGGADQIEDLLAELGIEVFVD